MEPSAGNSKCWFEGGRGENAAGWAKLRMFGDWAVAGCDKMVKKE